jgi:4'-phosphopantetheinyl transferase
MIRLHWATPSIVMAQSDPASLLSPAEAERMRRFHRHADRDRFAVAWSMVRSVLGELTQTDPRELTFDRRCAHCGDPQHGKPRLASEGPDFSLSHSHDRVVLAIADAGLVGVDVEDAGHDVDELAPLILHPDEPVVRGRELLRVWVRKEAVLKATGHGLALPMTSIRLDDPPRAASVRDVTADDGYVAAIATIAVPAEVME